MTSEQTDLLRTETVIITNRTRQDQTDRGVNRNGLALRGTTAYLDWTGQDWTGLDQIGPDWTGQDRTGPDRTEQDPTRLGRTDETCCCLEEWTSSM